MAAPFHPLEPARKLQLILPAAREVFSPLKDNRRSREDSGVDPILPIHDRRSVINDLSMVHGMRPVVTRSAFEIRTPESGQPSRRDRKKAETRARIGRAALELISRRGLAGTSVEEITEAADVGKGTFFNYFPSKEYVFLVLVEIQYRKLRQALAEAERGRRSIRLVLHDLFLALAKEPGSSQDLTAALVSAILGSGKVRDLAAAGMSEGRRLLSYIFSLGQERGEVRGDADPRIMSLAFQEALFGTLVVWAIQPEEKLPARLSANFKAYWRGIAAGKGASK